MNLKDDKSSSAKSDGKEATSENLKDGEKKEKEPDFEMVQNPTRVIKPQVN